MIKEFVRGFRGFGECISAVVNAVLLSVVYIFGVGITSAVAKISGKHFIERRRAGCAGAPAAVAVKNEATYWRELNLSKKPKEEYCRQF